MSKEVIKKDIRIEQKESGEKQYFLHLGELRGMDEVWINSDKMISEQKLSTREPVFTEKELVSIYFVLTNKDASIDEHSSFWQGLLRKLQTEISLKLSEKGK